MPYIVNENFSAGLDRRKSIMTAPSGTLWSLKNAHITRGGEIEKRKAFVSHKTLPSNSYGLHSVRGQLYTFGSVASGSLSPSIPAGVTYQRLQHPGSAAMSKLIAAENFNGKIYAIAEYDDGSIYHFYDGSRVTSWDTVAASVGSNSAVAQLLAEKINLSDNFTATTDGAVITITKDELGSSFTYSKSTTNGAGVNDQDITFASVQAAVSASAGSKATFSFTVLGGSEDPGVNKVSSITVNSVEILGAAVDWATNNTTTAEAIADQINTYASTPNYTATFSGDTVTVSYPTVGTGGNGLAWVVTCAGNVAVNTASGNTSGGVNAVTGLSQVITATVSGTFETDDKFSITLDGTAYICAGSASGTGRSIRTLKDKLYSTTTSLLYFCATGTPTSFSSGTGQGFINMSNQNGGSEDLTGLAVYQRNLAVFSKDAIQVWYVDADPAANSQLQVMPNIGTNARKSIVSIGESDVFFLSRGVRSLRARDSSNSAAVYDIGTPIDALINDDYLNLSEQSMADAVAAIEPVDGRYWLAIDDKIYVFSFFPTSKISAWSIYEPGVSFTDFAVIGRQIFGRASNTVYLYGGSDGDTYGDDYDIEVELPYFDAKQPATTKEWTGVDFALEGSQWTVTAGFDATDPDSRSTIAVLNSTTFNIGRVPISGNDSTHIGLKLVHSGAGYAKLANAIIHYNGGEAL